MAMTRAPEIVGRFPPTFQQRGIIAMLTSSPTEFPYMVRLAYLVRPAIDLRRLQRSFEKLTARHDALRQSFERQGDDWFVNVWNRHRTGLVVEDHGDISDSQFQTLLEEQSSVHNELLDDVLFQAIVLRCGKRGDVLFIRCHHSIVDGHSMVILVEDWLHLLIGIPLTGRGVTHQEYLAEQSTVSPRQVIENQKYWNQLLFPVLPNPGLGKFGNYGERPRIVSRTESARRSNSAMTSADFIEIPTVLNAPSQTPFSIVLAAFADTLIELSGLAGIYVSTTSGRTSKKLRNYVGCTIVWPPVRCDAGNGGSLAEFSSNLSSQLKQSLGHLPHEAAAYESDIDLAVHKSGGVLRHFNCSMDFTGTRVTQSPFSSSFTEAKGAPQKIGPFVITRLGIDAQNHNLDGLRLMIRPDGNRTNFELKYQNNFYTEKDIETLLSGMQERLGVRFI